MRAQRTSEQWPAGNHLTALTLNFVNRAERAIKPFVIGRKNWMFSPTANGV